jgi:hypothetical protein
MVLNFTSNFADESDIKTSREILQIEVRSPEIDEPVSYFMSGPPAEIQPSLSQNAGVNCYLLFVIGV